MKNVYIVYSLELYNLGTLSVPLPEHEFNIDLVTTNYETALAYMKNKLIPKLQQFIGDNEHLSFTNENNLLSWSYGKFDGHKKVFAYITKKEVVEKWIQ